MRFVAPLFLARENKYVHLQLIFRTVLNHKLDRKLLINLSHKLRPPSAKIKSLSILVTLEILLKLGLITNESLETQKTKIYSSVNALGFFEMICEGFSLIVAHFNCFDLIDEHTVSGQ